MAVAVDPQVPPDRRRGEGVDDRDLLAAAVVAVADRPADAVGALELLRDVAAGNVGLLLSVGERRPLLLGELLAPVLRAGLDDVAVDRRRRDPGRLLVAAVEPDHPDDRQSGGNADGRPREPARRCPRDGRGAGWSRRRARRRRSWPLRVDQHPARRGPVHRQALAPNPGTNRSRLPPGRREAGPEAAGREIVRVVRIGGVGDLSPDPVQRGTVAPAEDDGEVDLSARRRQRSRRLGPGRHRPGDPRPRGALAGRSPGRREQRRQRQTAGERDGDRRLRPPPASRPVSPS